MEEFGRGGAGRFLTRSCSKREGFLKLWILVISSKNGGCRATDVPVFVRHTQRRSTLPCGQCPRQLPPSPSRAVWLFNTCFGHNRGHLQVGAAKGGRWSASVAVGCQWLRAQFRRILQSCCWPPSPHTRELTAPSRCVSTPHDLRLRAGLI